MKIIRYILFIFALLIFNNSVAFAVKNEVRLGLLKFGSVNWEIDIIKKNNLEKKHNIKIITKFFANKNAASVALQGDAVDIIVTDWIWVSRQRSKGKMYSFYPHSMSVGGIMVPHDSEILSVNDLENKKLGIAGGSIDKSWLLFRAYLQKNIGQDGKTFLKPTYAAPPLLNKLILKNEIDAVLNYWHYKARLESQGLRELISVKEILENIGIKTRIPAYGWVFNEEFAKKNSEILNNFLNASEEAKKIMMISDTEWERIFPLTQAKDRATLISLRDTYRNGIPTDFSIREIEETKKAFKIFSKFGGKDLAGVSNDISPGTFWSK